MIMKEQRNFPSNIQWKEGNSGKMMLGNFVDLDCVGYAMLKKERRNFPHVLSVLCGWGNTRVAGPVNNRIWIIRKGLS